MSDTACRGREAFPSTPPASTSAPILGDATSTDKYNTTIDTLTGSLSFAPLTHLDLGGNAYYTDNLEGTLYNTLLTAGVTRAAELRRKSRRMI